MARRKATAVAEETTTVTDAETVEAAETEAAKEKRTKGPNQVTTEFGWTDEVPASVAQPGGRGRAADPEWASYADALREAPGRWAKVAQHAAASGASGLATRIRKGGLKSFTPAGHFEAVYRQPVAGEYHVYARYVGEQATPAEAQN